MLHNGTCNNTRYSDIKLPFNKHVSRPFLEQRSHTFRRKSRWFLFGDVSVSGLSSQHDRTINIHFKPSVANLNNLLVFRSRHSKSRRAPPARRVWQRYVRVFDERTRYEVTPTFLFPLFLASASASSYVEW